MNSDLKITLSRVLEKPLQINGKPLTKEYSRFFNEPKKQYELTIKNYLQWKI